MLDTAIKVEKLKKQYKLGAIGGATLNAELQSWWARKRGKEDPNLKVGQSHHDVNESFWALNGIDLEVKKGEALGIIGANGAGKSTLLKILSRVTAPTEGEVWINGRITSMLEVGTGFHGEMTGRENIYMNGAILGMSRKEVDAKMESIIDFSECRQFIDTPVKRYSSGMYVKLAFAVASHLDSEIMIMDEVLAVGDANFQKKCLEKMSNVVANKERTILYVSHNMTTIRNLCSRCIVLNKGQIIYNGDVEGAIGVYIDSYADKMAVDYDFTSFQRVLPSLGVFCKIEKVKLANKISARYKTSEDIYFDIEWEAVQNLNNIIFDITLKYIDGSPVGFTQTKQMDYKKGKYQTRLRYNISNLAEGMYIAYFHISIVDSLNNLSDLEQTDKIYFEVIEDKEGLVRWKRQYFGSIRLNELQLIGEEEQVW